MEEKSLKKRMDARSEENIASVLTEPATIALAVSRKETSEGMPRASAEIVKLETAKSSHPPKTPQRAAKKNPVEEHIGKQLKTIYNDVLAQPIPDRFLDLLNQLDTRPNGSTRGSDRSEGE